MRIGSELSGNEAIKQMCAAGFGPAYLSLHTCILEIKAGLLGILPLPNNPFSREWYVVRLFATQVPPLALAFEPFLCKKGKTEVAKQLPIDWGCSFLAVPPDIEKNTAVKEIKAVD